MNPEQPAPTQPGTQPPQPLPPPQAGDIVGILVLAAFLLLFLLIGVKFVRRQRGEKLETLTRELEKPVGEGERVLPPPSEEPIAPGEAVAPTAREAEAVPVARPAPRRDEEAEVRAYHKGLEKTRTGFFAKLNQLLSPGRQIDAKVVEELESVLIQADVGVRTTQRLLDMVKERLSRGDLSSAEKVRDALREEMLRIVSLDAPNIEERKDKPFVVMIVGVNGAGKTTTIGKLAARLTGQGKKVVLGAGDTFRAAAVEQLKIWGERAKSETVSGKEGQDPASVLFECVKKGKDDGADFVIADTAGRLHTKVNLMEELKKVHRVMGKAHEGAPHEVWLVVDATTGQNAVVQAEQFNQALKLSGIVLTKLDGTAKGGVVVAVCDQLKVPVRYVGVGESVEDLRPFNPKAFVDSLFE
ncbi:MAG: signal recognition particle-docking protein FtsY [Myxococcota bacterium]